MPYRCHKPASTIADVPKKLLSIDQQVNFAAMCTKTLLTNAINAHRPYYTGT